MMNTTALQDASQPTNLSSASRDQRNRGIEAQVLVELRNSAYAPVRQVECDLHESTLTLHGQVPSYYMKQIAQTIVHRMLDSNMAIDNGLEVVSDCNK